MIRSSPVFLDGGGKKQIGGIYMIKDNLHKAGQYFAEANRDIKSFDLLVGERLYNNACHQAQKSIENCIKGIFIAMGTNPPGTQSILMLVSKIPLSHVGENEKALLQDATKLDRMGAPSVFEPMSKKDAAEAWDIFVKAHRFLTGWAKQLGVPVDEAPEEVKYAGKPPDLVQDAPAPGASSDDMPTQP